MPLTNETTHGGVTVVSHGIPDPELLRKAVAVMARQEMKKGESKDGKNAA